MTGRRSVCSYCRHRALALATVLVVGNSALAGPITFNTALPVHEGEVIVREQVIWRRATGDATAQDRELDVIAAPTVVVYGIHPRVALFGILPFLHKELDVTTETGRRTRSTTGFGDLTALVRFTAFTRDRRGETVRLAPFVGLEVPTGADDEADSLGRLPQPLQAGSGSWDALGGVIFTWQKLRWQLDLAGSYQARTEANGFEAGDEVRGDASFQWRVIPWDELGPGVPSYLFAVLESNVIWQADDTLADGPDPDTGGVRWFLAPGLQWVTTRAVVEAAVQLPVLQDLGADALEDDFIARVSLRLNF